MGIRLPVGRPRTRPTAVAGDKAYSSRANRAYLRGRGAARKTRAVESNPPESSLVTPRASETSLG